MDNFETLLTTATARGSNSVPGVVLAAVDKTGNYIYDKASGFKGVAPDASPIDINSIFWIASCTKLITTIAALQCVERGLVTLDEPVCGVLPELEKLPIIAFNNGADKDIKPFIFTPPTNEITLRQLLTHSSGIAYDMTDPRLKVWRASRGQKVSTFSSKVVEAVSTPLIFEPGQSWLYGAGVDWAGVMIGRLNGNITLGQYLDERIFKPLKITSSTFHLERKPNVRERLVPMTAKLPDGGLVPAPLPLPDPVSED